MNNFEAVKGAMKDASGEDLKILTPDQRIAVLRNHGGAEWEIGYWEDWRDSREEIDRVPRDRLGNLAYRHK